ncbi:TPA: hypothetical protein KQW76_002745 [Clostridioides difficile]|nr:hypothetical protein [Clostridioides difficile]EJA6689686.1 hypothetical protein [Clostridioides difficile]EQH51485.1 hypothetical protein QMG_3586 [Clostridioides difficile DA00256]MBJ9760736.1 hypothetical protein [Clostridioides difficile]MCA0587059.1 hypothetical protein [Clostridioides difficile]MDO0484831.1 hypothetical protein [Clostridioides difficile]
MNTQTIERINAEEIINILSNIIQKHIIKIKETTRGEEDNEQKSSNIL